MEPYVSFAMDKTVELLAIDSPTGYTREAERFVSEQFAALGFPVTRTVKGGILVDLGGEDAENALLLEAHADTLGGMVAEIKSSGRLRIRNVGGMNANNAEAENCRIVTKADGSYATRRSMSTVTTARPPASGTRSRSCLTSRSKMPTT